MAVAAARRVRADRAAKDRVLKSLVQNGGSFADKMSYEQPHHSSGAGAMPPPIPVEPPRSPRGAEERESSLKKRKAFKGKVPADLRRSASTPHIRSLALSDASALSPTDKRRNKLGYHRTSVACGHCRRRKIRCLLPSPEDPHGRCANCIRLKKECNFYPVDQTMTAETLVPNTPVKETASGPQSASSQSSPRIPVHANQGGKPDDLQGHHQLTGPGQDVTHESDSSSYGVQAPSGGSFQAPTFPFPTQPASGWSPNNPPVASHQSQQVSPSYWNAHQPSATYSASQETTLQQIGATPYEMPTFPFQQDAHPWTPPTRSMSFGHIDSIPQVYPYHELPQHGMPGSIPNYHFAPQSGNQHITPPGTHQRVAHSSMVAEQMPPAFTFQKPWSATPEQAYTGVAGQHEPAPGSVWFPQPPHFTHTGGQPDSTPYGHPQQYASNPG